MIAILVRTIVGTLCAVVALAIFARIMFVAMTGTDGVAGEILALLAAFLVHAFVSPGPEELADLGEFFATLRKR